ncbi:hypothetical protein TrVFT333_006819 [Trichoderma virens FT-333]|nr:hypothetical protein TrVFT333_006819 [Trichoderma virens FT-333]
MPPFESPSPPFSSTQLRAWFDNVEPKLRDPSLLFGRLHEKFNTITIPVLRESDYFNNILRIAKLAGGREADIQRIYEEENKQRREKLKSLFARAANQTIYNDEIFPCTDARDTVADVCLTGCLLDFLRLLKGNAFGWEADAAEDIQLGGATSNPSEETQSSVNQEIQDPYDDPGTETQVLGDNYYYTTPIERRIREEQSANATYYIGTYTYTGCTTPISNGTTYNPDISASDISVSEMENSETKAPTRHGKRKRNRFDDVSDARAHRRELKSITHSSIPYTTIEQAIERSKTDDNTTLDDDGSSYVYKRRKLESSFALKPTSINPASQVAAEKETFKKRSRYNDCDDYERRHKRQKLESSAAYTLPNTSSSIQQLTDRKVAAKKSRLKGNDSYGYSSPKKKKSSLKALRSPGLASTRSARRTGQSTFWELDNSGKPRSI